MASEDELSQHAGADEEEAVLDTAQAGEKYNAPSSPQPDPSSPQPDELQDLMGDSSDSSESRAPSTRSFKQEKHVFSERRVHAPCHSTHA